VLIGTINIKIFIPSSQSLKDKRRVVKRLIKKLQNKFNISVAEIDSLEQWQVSEIGVAIVGNETRVLDQQISRIIDFIDEQPDFQLVNIVTQIL
jgi:hypothetical protein